MSTFVLVHGAFHGAWCWDRLVPELRSLGHDAITMDLPIDDPTAGNVRYAEVIVEAIGAHDDTLLVGHSLGGLSIPLVAAARPVRRLIVLCAFVPIPGHPFSDQYGDPGIFPTAPEGSGPVMDPDGLMTWPPAGAIQVFYPDCPADVAGWATSRLRRQSLAPHGEVCPLDAWPDVPSSSILCREDLAIGSDWARRVAVERLGTVAEELPGGHSPFLSRPAELAAVLHKISLVS